MILMHCVVLLTVFFVASHARLLNPMAMDTSHVKLVDYSSITGNFLYRSGEPKNTDGTFAWDTLNTTFAKIAASNGIPFPTDYYLYDLCLLTTETSDINMERAYFQQNPTKGKFETWPIWGIVQSDLTSACKTYNIKNCNDVQPKTFSSADLKTLSTNYDSWADPIDSLEYRIPYTYNLLHTKYSKPYVILFHCECGCDRTGEFYAAYAMQYMNQTFTQAMSYDITIPNRNICYNNQVGSEWYCENLYFKGDYPHANDCGNCDPFACSQHPC